MSGGVTPIYHSLIFFHLHVKMCSIYGKFRPHVTDDGKNGLKLPRQEQKIPWLCQLYHSHCHYQSPAFFPNNCELAPNFREKTKYAAYFLVLARRSVTCYQLCNRSRNRVSVLAIQYFYSDSLSLPVLPL